MRYSSVLNANIRFFCSENRNFLEKFNKFVSVSRNNAYLCKADFCRKPRMGKARVGDIYIKGVTVRFGFDVLEPGKLKRFVKNKATGTPYRGVYTFASRTFPVTVCYGKMFGCAFDIYVIVGLSALLVSTNRAIPGP